MKPTIAFDLDGTLLDTLGTIHHHLQATLTSYGYLSLPLETTKDLVGRGLGKLLADAVAVQAGVKPESIQIEDMIHSLVQSYQQDPFTNTTVYPGIKELLWELKEVGYQLVVTTNKDQTIAQSLCNHFLPDVFSLVLGPEPPIPAKPDPGMIQVVQEQLGTKPQILVGDSEVDLETAKNSNLNFIPVTWGFRSWNENNLHGHIPVSSSNELKKIISYLISGKF
jgi:phosphoglycolate phosphatase